MLRRRPAATEEPGGGDGGEDGGERAQHGLRDAHRGERSASHRVDRRHQVRVERRLREGLARPPATVEDLARQGVVALRIHHQLVLGRQVADLEAVDQAGQERQREHCRQQPAAPEGSAAALPAFREHARVYRSGGRIDGSSSYLSPGAMSSRQQPGPYRAQAASGAGERFTNGGRASPKPLGEQPS